MRVSSHQLAQIAAIAALLPISLCTGPSARGQGASFQGLGDLPGGTFQSIAMDVSADGSVVVGFSDDAGPGEVPFRWSEVGGMVSLPFLPGTNWALARGVSDDGTVVVGNGANVALKWTTQGGVVQLEALSATAPSDVANGVSGDGLVAVGQSTGAGGSWAVRWTPGLQIIPGTTSGSFATAASRDGSTIVGRHNNAGIGLPFRWTTGGGHAILPLLPGGQSAFAGGVSADGSVVVGYGQNAQGFNEAFRWTASTNATEGLGDLEGGAFQSFASGLSEDGSVVVGRGTTANGVEAFIWTPAGGMRSLRASLVALGIDMTGWTLANAVAVSADGTVIVGTGTNPQGQNEAWRAFIPVLNLVAPTAGAVVIAGERTRVRWSAPPLSDLLEVVLLPDTLGATAVTVDFGLIPSDTAVVWSVPDALFSRSARLVLRVMTDHSIADTSDYFRIKPYHLTRLAAGGSRYVPFMPSQHGWSFANTTANMFPPTWYSLPAFNYTTGVDPFTGVGYDDNFDEEPIGGYVGAFPDWPAFVRAFGTDAAYSLVVPNVEAWYRGTFTAAWGGANGSPVAGGTNHNGSCFGLAVSSLMAFTHREAFGTRYPAIGPVAQLFGLPLTEAARETANELYSHQFGAVNVATTSAALGSTDPRRVLADLKSLFGQDDAPTQQRNITIYRVSNCAPLATNGAHTMTPYRLQRDASGAGRWRILVYDSNSPGDDTNSFIQVDSTLNTWTFAGFSPAWGGSCAMILEDRIQNYLNPALPPAGGQWAGRVGGDSLHVSVTPAGDVTLASAAGVVGHSNGLTFNTITGALPLVPKVGGPASPDAYLLPSGAYSLTIDNPTAARQAAWFDDGQALYGYGRSDAEPTHVDRVRYESSAGGLTAMSTDVGVSKRITLRAVLPPSGDPERSIDAADLILQGVDSVSFASVAGAAGPRMRLQNLGGAKTYTLRLQQSDASGGARFRHVGVPLVAGATHLARPVWTTLGTGPVEIDVDLDGDGTPDEVLVLENQPVGTDPGVPPSGALDLVLHPPAPNPSSGSVTLRYELPAAGPVRLALFDALGREVAVLVDGDRPAGVHEVSLDAGRLAPGTYVARLNTLGSSQAQRLSVGR